MGSAAPQTSPWWGGPQAEIRNLDKRFRGRDTHRVSTVQIERPRVVISLAWVVGSHCVEQKDCTAGSDARGTLLENLTDDALA